PQAEVLSLHLPLTARTRGLLDQSRLQLLPEGAIFINTARGEIVDETALISLLRNGHLHAAGLDTMAVEPLSADSPLCSLDNVVLTPHVAGSTPSALALMAQGAAENVMSWLTGSPPDAKR